jgi:hypothetical protein
LYILLHDFIYVYFENIRLCDLNLIFRLSICICPFPFSNPYFPNSLPFLSKKNIETKIEIGFSVRFHRYSLDSNWTTKPRRASHDGGGPHGRYNDETAPDGTIY